MEKGSGHIIANYQYIMNRVQESDGAASVAEDPGMDILPELAERAPMDGEDQGFTGALRLRGGADIYNDYDETFESSVSGNLRFSLVSAQDASRVASVGRGLKLIEHFVVPAKPEDVLGEVNGEVRITMNIVEVINGLVERLSAGGRRVLFEEDFDDELVREALEAGDYTCLTREQILDALARARNKTVLAITGGGDCAGIADFLASFSKYLREYVMLGVKHAGKGLIVDPDEFDDHLVVVDRLLAEDLGGQASTPFGSAREDALRKNPANTLANIRGRRAFVGTGGNDHLGLLERIAREFPEMCVTGTFKSIDGDGWVDGRPAQMLGFDSAVRDYRQAVYSIAASAAAHEQITVVETFGRNCGRLPFEAARRDPKNFKKLGAEEQRKIIDFGDTVMILVPEKPVSLAAVAREAMRRKKEEGSCVVVVAEGFMPPELRSEMQRLSKNEVLRKRWQSGILKVDQIPGLIEIEGKDDPRNDLRFILQDPELAAQFAKTLWNGKLDSFGNGVKLSGIRKFIMAAIEKLGGASKVNEGLQNYQGRGATPSEYDRCMGRKIGKKMARLVRDGVTGGKAVVYLEGMNALEEDPVVVDLVGVSDKNNLANEDLYPNEVLRRGGVFWEE